MREGIAETMRGLAANVEEDFEAEREEDGGDEVEGGNEVWRGEAEVLLKRAERIHVERLVSSPRLEKTEHSRNENSST